MAILSNNSAALQSQGAELSCRKARAIKPKKSNVELVAIFWALPTEALFGQETIAPVTNKSIKTLEGDRWRGTGIPYRKIDGRVLYQKKDVVAWLESHELVTSTSAYVKGE